MAMHISDESYYSLCTIGIRGSYKSKSHSPTAASEAAHSASRSASRHTFSSGSFRTGGPVTPFGSQSSPLDTALDKQQWRSGTAPSSGDWDHLMNQVPEPMPPSASVVAWSRVAARPGAAHTAFTPESPSLSCNASVNATLASLVYAYRTHRAPPQIMDLCVCHRRDLVCSMACG